VRVPVPAGFLVREPGSTAKLVSLVPAPVAKGGGQLSALLPLARGLLLDIAIPVSSVNGEEEYHSAFNRFGSRNAPPSVQLPRQAVDVRSGRPSSRKNPNPNSGSNGVAYGREVQALAFDLAQEGRGPPGHACLLAHARIADAAPGSREDGPQSKPKYVSK